MEVAEPQRAGGGRAAAGVCVGVREGKGKVLRLARISLALDVSVYPTDEHLTAAIPDVAAHNRQRGAEQEPINRRTICTPSHRQSVRKEWQ